MGHGTSRGLQGRMTLAQLDKMSDQLSKLQSDNDALFRSGPNNEWADRRTGKTVPYSEVQRIARELKRMRRQYDKAVESMP